MLKDCMLLLQLLEVLHPPTILLTQLLDLLLVLCQQFLVPTLKGCVLLLQRCMLTPQLAPAADATVFIMPVAAAPADVRLLGLWCCV